MRLRGGGYVGGDMTPTASAAPGVWSMADVLAARKAGTWPAPVYNFVNAEAAALVARFTTAPTNERKALIDNLVGSLKTAGVWSKLDALYLTAAHDTQAARQNWVQDLYNLTAVASPAFVADRGYSSDGANSYLRTGFVPRTAPSAKMVQNSAHVSVWDRTSRAAQDGYLMGAFDGAVNAAIWPRGAGNLAYLRVNDSAAAISNSDSSGFFVASRTGASARAGYRNGSLIGSGTEAAGQPSNSEIFVCVRQNVSSPGFALTDQVAQASIGGGLTSAEQLAFYNALSTYLTAIGAA